jgi:hypothetical protein
MPKIISLVLVGFTFLCNFNGMPEIISLVLVGFTLKPGMISGIPLKLHKNVNPTKTRDDLRHSVKIT